MFSVGMVSTGARLTAVLVKDKSIVDLSVALPRVARSSPPTGSDTLELLKRWDESLLLLRQVAAEPNPADFLDSSHLRWLPPVHFPGKLINVAANYSDHLAEMGGVPIVRTTSRPYFFLKSPRNTMIGNGARIVIPPVTRAVDWEVELAVVIGRQAKNIAADEAMQFVAGYAVFNDITARDLVRRPNFRYSHDWMQGKSLDTFGPFGPTLVPREFVPDCHNLGLRLSVNGVLKQDGNTADMVCRVPDQIAFLSELITLEPGDVIATGTPAGVGAPNNDFLKAGDIVVAEIDGLGRMTNPVGVGSA